MITLIDNTPMLDLQSAEDELNVSRSTLFELRRSGRLTEVKRGKRKFVPLVEVQTLIKERDEQIRASRTG